MQPDYQLQPPLGKPFALSNPHSPNAVHTPLFLKARAIDGATVIAEALNLVPGISKSVRGIGWSLVVEQMEQVEFYEDVLAFATADSYDDGRRMLLAFGTLLDRHADDIAGIDECFLQAWVVGEKMDTPIRHLNLRWCRHRAMNARVVSLFGPGRDRSLNP